MVEKATYRKTLYNVNELFYSGADNGETNKGAKKSLPSKYSDTDQQCESIKYISVCSLDTGRCFHVNETLCQYASSFNSY